jgi:hypothetical protein
MNEPNFKEPAIIGTVPAFLAFLNRKAANPTIQPTPDEYTWVYMFFCCYKSPVIMSVEENALPPVPVEPDQVAVASVVDRTRVVSPVHSLKDDSECFFILDNQALVELASRQFNCGSAVNRIVSIGVRTRTNILFQKAAQRYNDFCKIELPTTKEFQNHWAMTAFGENLKQCCEIVGLNRHINENIAATNFKESLLQPPQIGYFQSIVKQGDRRNEHLQGILLYADTTRFSLCHVVAVHGDQSFSKQYKQHEKDAKKPSTEFSRAYPHSAPSNPTQGGWKAPFGSLVPLAAIAYNPHVEHDCLSERGDGGLFRWSDATINKLESCSVTGANSLEEKQAVFVLHMLQFTYQLMMHQDTCVPIRPFNIFMGRALNLHNGRSKK